jgi:hypothetical protein
MSMLTVLHSVDLAVIELCVLQPASEQASAMAIAGRRILGFMNRVS